MESLGPEEYSVSVSRCFDTIRMIRKVENDKKLGFWIIISILIGIVFIVAHNMISFGNS